MSQSPRSWTCSGCGVRISRIDGGRVRLPESWERSDGALFCLLCRRGRAADAAEDVLPDETGLEERAKARRSGLIEFEVRRTPDLTDRTIAQACRTSAATVAAARRRLNMDDGPPAGADGKWGALRARGARGRAASPAEPSRRARSSRGS